MLTRYQRRKLSDSIDIVDAFKHYNIRLFNDSSGRLKCTCPFHYDKSPSLKIYPQDNTWYSYCCNRGTTVWDFLKYKEEDFDEAEKILKELATIEIPEDPLDCISDELREKTKDRTESQIRDLVFSLNITLRDFLRMFINKSCYDEICLQVDIFFKQIDDLLEQEDLELSEVEDLQESIQNKVKRILTLGKI